MGSSPPKKLAPHSVSMRRVLGDSFFDLTLEMLDVIVPSSLWSWRERQLREFDASLPISRREEKSYS